MPIGKNSLKRVSNNGYSNVSVSAPDMEHSTVIEKIDPQVEILLPKTEAPKKVVTAKTAHKSNTAPKAKSPKTPKIEAEKAETSHPDGFVRYSFGMELPAHLL